MVKKFSEIFVFIATVLLSGLLSVAKELPSLPSDPSVSAGSLPDRIQYYLVSNPTHKGMADFALVWRLAAAPVDSSMAADSVVRIPGQKALDVARKALLSTDLFPGSRPVSFLRRNGVQGGDSGYIGMDGDALTFRFSGVNLNRGEQFLDSLFLLTFSMAREYSAALRSYGAVDCGQAVIVSGDIDRDAMLSKMKLLSLFVPDIAPEAPPRFYTWTPGDSLSCRYVPVPGAEIAHVMAEYSFPRVPDSYIATVLPYVSEQLGTELGLILEKRLEERFYGAGIPFSEVRSGFRGSSRQGGDEKFTVSFGTVPEKAREAVSVLSSSLSDMSRSGVSIDEYAWARDIAGMAFRKKAGEFKKSNVEYVQKCIASFLYGSAVVSDSDRYSFFGASALPDSSGLRFFNRFASSLVGNTDNLVLTCFTDTTVSGPYDIRDRFLRSWDGEDGGDRGFNFNIGDTSRFDAFAGRSKITRSRTENVSGGSFWTFSNGMKVIYKPIASGGRFWYSMILKGGFSSVPGLEPGQGAFFLDMLGLYKVAGMERKDLDALLAAKDIEMETEVGPAYMRISGSSAQESLQFLLKVLCATASASEADSTAFGYYAQCERLRLEERTGYEKRMVAIDSIICPDFRYSVLKSSESLEPGLQRVADGYFRKQFSKCNDGVIVIVGDLNETVLKKTLQSFLGAFPVSQRIYPQRGYGKQPVSGASTYIVDGPKSSLDLVMSASVELDAQTFMASKVAAMAMNDAVVSALDGTPASIRVSDSFAVVPSERLSMAVRIEACDTAGFAVGTEPFRPVRALFGVRSAIDDVADEGIPQEKIDIYKKTLKNAAVYMQGDPEYWMDVLSWRVIYGKDFHTGCEEKIDAVTPDMVRDLIHSLDNGTKVEYIVRPKRK